MAGYFVDDLDFAVFELVVDEADDIVGVGLAAGVVAGEVEEGFEETGFGGGEGGWFLVRWTWW